MIKIIDRLIDRFLSSYLEIKSSELVIEIKEDFKSS